MIRSLIEFFIWGIGWSALSFLLVLDQPHALLGILSLGASYGFSAGFLYATMSYFYRRKRDNTQLVIAMLLGLVASISTAPILELLGAKMPIFLRILAITGLITGVVVNFLAQAIENRFQTHNQSE
jgi:Na+/proline symporter